MKSLRIKRVMNLIRAYGRHSRRGSFTVETAAIMPVVLLVVFGCLYLCFFVHNRTFLTASAYEAAVCGGMEGVKRNGDPLGAASQRSTLLGNTGFFGAENFRSAVDAGTEPGSLVSVTYDHDTLFQPFLISWHMHAEGQARVFRPAETIRGRRRGNG